MGRLVLRNSSQLWLRKHFLKQTHCVSLSDLYPQISSTNCCVNNIFQVWNMDLKLRMVYMLSATICLASVQLEIEMQWDDHHWLLYFGIENKFPCRTVVCDWSSYTSTQNACISKVFVDVLPGIKYMQQFNNTHNFKQNQPQLLWVRKMLYNLVNWTKYLPKLTINYQ